MLAKYKKVELYFHRKGKNAAAFNFIMPFTVEEEGLEAAFATLDFTGVSEVEKTRLWNILIELVRAEVVRSDWVEPDQWDIVVKLRFR